MKHITLISIFLTIILQSNSQIFINEFMASNQNGIIDNYGEYDDWIEIYNPSGSDYNLGGLYISDNLIMPTLYQIPLGNDSLIVPAGGYLLLWADDDIEQGAIHLGFKLTGSGEQVGIFDGMGNVIDTVSFGNQNNDVSYGRSPDGSNNWVYFSESTPEQSNLTTYLSPSEVNLSFPHTSNYTYSIDIHSNVNWSVSFSSSWLSVDPTSGSNNGVINLTSTQENNTGSDRETILTFSGSGVNNQEVHITQYTSSSLPDLVINEFMAENDNTIADNFGQYNDWIEIYNKENSAVDIGGMYFTDNLDEPLKFQISTLFPDSTTIEPGGFLLFWADDDTEEGIFHLNFKLSNNGEEIGLFHNEFDEIDIIEYDIQSADISYGRVWDGGNSWQFFTIPTPGYSNSLDIEETMTSQLRVFPNPVDDYLIIDSQTNTIDKIDLYAIDGKLLISEFNHDNSYIMDVSDLPSGIFFIKISSVNKIFTDKIFIR